MNARTHYYGLRAFHNNLLAGSAGSDLLWERATELSIVPQGQTSANSSCRLLPTRDGYIAINLARAEDWSLLPAWRNNQRQIGRNLLRRWRPRHHTVASAGV